MGIYLLKKEAKMVEFKLKALREWRNFLRILAGVLLIVCLLGFWKFFGHGPKEAVAAGWWLKAAAAGFTLLLSETLRRVIEVFEAQEEQQKELHQGRF